MLLPFCFLRTNAFPNTNWQPGFSSLLLCSWWLMLLVLQVFVVGKVCRFSVASSLVKRTFTKSTLHEDYFTIHLLFRLVLTIFYILFIRICKIAQTNEQGMNCENFSRNQGLDLTKNYLIWVTSPPPHPPGVKELHRRSNQYTTLEQIRNI